MNRRSVSPTFSSNVIFFPAEYSYDLPAVKMFLLRHLPLTLASKKQAVARDSHFSRAFFGSAGAPLDHLDIYRLEDGEQVQHFSLGNKRDFNKHPV